MILIKKPTGQLRARIDPIEGNESKNIVEAFLNKYGDVTVHESDSPSDSILDNYRDNKSDQPE